MVDIYESELKIWYSQVLNLFRTYMVSGSKNIQNLGINEQSHVTFWLKEQKHSYSHRYQPVYLYASDWTGGKKGYITIKNCVSKDLWR